MIQLSEIITTEMIELDYDAKSKEELLKKISELAVKSPVLEEISSKTIYDKLKNREEISSTAFGSKIAIPHCPIEGISDFVIGAIRTSHGVDFDSLDGEPTRIFIFIILPADKRDAHIRVLSKLANVLKNENNVEKLLKADTREGFKQQLVNLTDRDLEKEKSKEYDQFNILIQEEELFDTVLSNVAEIEDCSIAIFETNSASDYIHKQPLFSEFWSREEQKYNRLIQAVVNKSFANDLIRKLNVIIDEQEEKNLAFWVQELFYFNGKVNL